MFNKALVPLDGTEMAEGILPFVTQIAKGLDMKLVLLSVIDPEAIDLPERLRSAEGNPALRYVQSAGPGATTGANEPPARHEEESRIHPHETGGPYASQVLDSVQQAVADRLEEKVRSLEGQGIKVEFVVEFGSAADKIIEVADAQGCDLIAMSTHGRGGIGRGLLGSVTDKVIHASNRPTLTITPERAKEYWGEGEPMKRVIVPLDGSLRAESALPYVEAIARALSLKVVLARVLKIDAFYGAYGDGFMLPSSLDIEEEIESDAKEYLNGVAERLRANGLEVEWQLMRGAPAAAITDMAQESPQNLIALTSRGHSGITRWVLGSVAEALVRSSGDPVLIVPQTST